MNCLNEIKFKGEKNTSKINYVKVKKKTKQAICSELAIERVGYHNSVQQGCKGRQEVEKLWGGGGKQGLSCVLWRLLVHAKWRQAYQKWGFFLWEFLGDHTWLTLVGLELEMRTKVREPSRHYPSSDSFGQLLYRL